LVELTKTAIQKGFYHLDCAEMYGTEEEVGVAIKESGVPREKLLVTNKVSFGIEDISTAVDESLRKMKMGMGDSTL
jgi:diketogulonate reductase-like aldo/keto reductase